MRRGELGETLNMEVDLIAEDRPNRPGTPISVSKLTIHNTSNKASGAHAKAHSKWVRETGYYILDNGKKNWVSWHFTVDDKRVIRHLPLNEKAWHAGPGNAVSLGIEICMNQDIDQPAAFDRAARLCACLLHDLSLTPNDVVTHKHWTGKSCPILLMEESEWNQFIEMIDHYLSGIKRELTTIAAVDDKFSPVTCDEPLNHATA